MIYQFERSEIKRCDGCEFFFGGVDGMSYEWGYCTRQEDIIDGHKTPQENNCPLVAISKTVTSDDVQRAIEELSAITALQQMRTEPCGIIHHDPEFAIGECGACGYEIDPDYGWNHCPACGRKL